MNVRLITLIFSVFCFVSSCCERPKVNENGFTKKNAIKTTTYLLEISYDSLGNPKKDTLSYTVREYNSKGNMVKRIDYSLFNEDTTQFIYHYNRFDKLKKEVVQGSGIDSIIEIDHIYKDSLLTSTKGSPINNDIGLYIQGKSSYSKNGSLRKTILESYSIDLVNKDTVFYVLETSYYDRKGLTKTTTLSKSLRSTELKTHRFDYYCNNLTKKTHVYDSDSDLIQKIRHKYTYDKHGNWITSKEYKNDTLITIQLRDIIY